MADERWRGAVEGYLNNQKYYLLVEPGRYQDALNIYDQLKQEAEYRAFGLVDIENCEKRKHFDRCPAVWRKRWRQKTSWHAAMWTIFWVG